MNTPHVAYIIVAYAFAFVVVAGLIAHAILDYRTQLKALADFEARGVQRRSLRKRAS